jgi:hypothetical protein
MKKKQGIYSTFDLKNLIVKAERTQIDNKCNLTNIELNLCTNDIAFFAEHSTKYQEDEVNRKRTQISNLSR